MFETAIEFAIIGGMVLAITLVFPAPQRWLALALAIMANLCLGFVFWTVWDADVNVRHRPQQRTAQPPACWYRGRIACGESR